MLSMFAGGQERYWHCAARRGSATRTASTTKAENVQFFPWMTSSTFCKTSVGKRMVLLVVGGVDGILKVAIFIPRNTIVLLLLYEYIIKLSALQTQYKYAMLGLFDFQEA